MPKMPMRGSWAVLDRLGGGGNGDVYRCRQHGSGREAAIKILRRTKPVRRDRIVRFKNEINFLMTRDGLPGVLPLLDHALPDDPRQSSWYVMPLAVPLTEALGPNPAVTDVVRAILQIAETLASLATIGVSHRDLKPDNLFQLDGDWVVGDFGLVKYPEQEQITRHGRPVGPYYFIAPEMRRHADTADGELADVYSLAKTLWSAATGRADPPQGEVRNDRPALRLSSYVEDERARSLDLLIERCTSDEPGRRPSMAELAGELRWWLDQSPVIPQLDLSKYRDEVLRLHEANSIMGEETDEQRSNRLYNEAIKSVQSGLSPILNAAMASAGLQGFAGGDNPIRNWSSEEYGGGATLPTWGIGSIASPWIAAAIGAVHRSQPIQDLDDMAVVFIIARMTPESQHDYIREFKRFRPGSLGLDSAIAEVASRITEMLPAIIADFLTACKQSGVPR